MLDGEIKDASSPSRERRAPWTPAGMLAVCGRVKPLAEMTRTVSVPVCFTGWSSSSSTSDAVRRLPGVGVPERLVECTLDDVERPFSVAVDDADPADTAFDFDFPNIELSIFNPILFLSQRYGFERE